MKQEKISGLAARFLAGFAAPAVLCVTGGCATRDLDGGKPLCMEVLGLKGDVRYSKNGKHWTRLEHSGGELLAGTIVKTGERSSVRMRPAKPNYGRTYTYAPDNATGYRPQVAPDDAFFLCPDSVVSLESLTWRKSKGMRGLSAMTRTVRLELRDGSIFGLVERRTNDSTCEIIFPNGRFHTEAALYSLNSSGTLVILEGKGTISIAGTGNEVEVTAGHRFDPGAGTVTEVDLAKYIRPGPLPDLEPIRRLVQPRPFLLPQRKF